MSATAKMMIVLVSLQTGISNKAHADDALIISEQLVQTFMGVCGQTTGRYERTIQIIEAMGADELSPDQQGLAAPERSDVESKSYILKGDNGPFGLGVSRALVEGVHNIGCVVAGDRVNVEEIVIFLGQVMALGTPRVDRNDMGQRYRIWDIYPENGKGMLIVTDGMPMGINAINLSLMTPEAK